MSGYQERPPTGEDNDPQRLIPLSEEAVMRGLLTSLGGGNRAWEEALKRFNAKKHIKQALETRLMGRTIAALVGNDEWAQRYGETSPLVYMSGGAIYYNCVLQEAAVRQMPIPDITIGDRAYWISGQIPNFEYLMGRLQQDLIDEEDRGLLLDHIGAIGDNFSRFETETEPDFCRVLDREITYPEEVLSDMKLGAMDLHYLFRAHYERAELQEHLSL